MENKLITNCEQCSEINTATSMMLCSNGHVIPITDTQQPAISKCDPSEQYVSDACQDSAMLSSTCIPKQAIYYYFSSNFEVCPCMYMYLCMCLTIDSLTSL